MNLLLLLFSCLLVFINFQEVKKTTGNYFTSFEIYPLPVNSSQHHNLRIFVTAVSQPAWLRQYKQREILELEVCAQVCEGQWESGQLKKKTCSKNPGHEGFMDIYDFNVNCLPVRYHNKLMTDFIDAVADLVVCLATNFVSPSRPDSDLLAAKRGQGAIMHGSGWVSKVYKKCTEERADHCPCRLSNRAHRYWAEIWVETALHVVYDDEEAAHTTCELFYNEEGRYQVSKLEGLKLEYKTDTQRDRCVIHCVTHDCSLANKLDDMIKDRDRLGKEVQKKYRGCKPDDVVVVVSHPHGCSKQVSWGKVTHRQKIPPFRHYYSAATCPGSSGGYVWIPGPAWSGGDFYRVSAHSLGSDNGNICYRPESLI